MKLNKKMIMLTFILMCSLSIKVAANEIIIDGLEDSTTYYLGSNVDVSVKNANSVQWQFTGDTSIVDYQINGASININMQSQGRIWLMAKLTDGSDMAREYAINIEDFPAYLNKYLIDAIKPIKSKGYQKILQVEVVGNDKVSTLQSYMKHLINLGEFEKLENVVESNYHLFQFRIDSQLVEIRLDTTHSQYSQMCNILNENYVVDGITPTPLPTPEPTESIVPTNKPSPTTTTTPDNILITQPESTIETNVNDNDRLIVFKLPKALSVDDKIASINQRLLGIASFDNLEYIEKTVNIGYISYFYQSDDDNGDSFYIELQVDEDDEQFIAIIEMLPDEKIDETLDVDIIYKEDIDKNNVISVQQSSMTFQDDNHDISKMIMGFLLAMASICWFYWFQNGKNFKTKDTSN